MKIVVNAVSAKVGGAVSYITGLVCHLPSGADDVEFVIFLPPETAAKLETHGRGIQIVPTEVGHASAWRRLWWDQVTLRARIKREKADVLFSSANFGMFLCPVRQLLLVRNALYFSKTYRERFLPGHSLKARIDFKLRRWLITQSARTADIVMTPTKAMLDDLLRYTVVKKAVVNPYGITRSGLDQEATPGMAKTRRASGNHALRLLYVSMYYEHKNLCTLLRAISLINRRGGYFTLTTTARPSGGGAGLTATHGEDIKFSKRAGIAEYVNFVGPLNHEGVEGLYRDSDVFVFPSLAESFGFPMVEAMAHGLPIVAADTPVNREVCGDAAVYFRPLSPEDLAERLLRLAIDRRLRGELASKGLQAARSRFCWNAHAQRLLNAARYRNREGIRREA